MDENEIEKEEGGRTNITKRVKIQVFLNTERKMLKDKENRLFRKK